jgi:hypothetical protein
MDDTFRSQYLKDLARMFGNYKSLAEAAMTQVSDEQLVTALSPEANSIANIARHISGNFQSRFRDFLTTDGEKPDRDRDGEFEAWRASRGEVLAYWEAGWTVATRAIEALTPGDLDRTITIRGESFLVVEALHRSVTHTAYHVGQIVFLAKHFAGAQWKSLSIPKGQSRQAGGQFKQAFVRQS